MREKIKEAFIDLSLLAGRLTPGQLDFVKGLQQYYSRYKTLTERQQKVLFDIRNTVREMSASEQKLSAW